MWPAAKTDNDYGKCTSRMKIRTKNCKNHCVREGSGLERKKSTGKERRRRKIIVEMTGMRHERKRGHLKEL